MFLEDQGGLVIYNKATRDFVPYRIDPLTGEVVIKSPNPKDSDLNCIVTTWENIYQRNLEKKGRG